MTMLSDITVPVSLSKTSYSALTKHRACPQQWAYEQLWRLRVPPSDEVKVEARFGLMWHALRAADSIKRGRGLGSMRFVPEALKIGDDADRVPTTTDDPVAAVLDAVAGWERAALGRAAGPDQTWADVWQEKLGGQPLALLTNLDRRYRAQWAEETLHEAPIGVEVGWGRVLPGEGTSIRLVGYTDEVYLDTKRGVVCIRDHKTTKSMSTTNAATDMLNSQLHLNLWGLVERIEEWGVQAPTVVTYDRVNSHAPSRPSLTKAGKLSKATTRWDLDTYLAFCSSAEAKAHGYEPESSVVERLSTPAAASAWFQRTRVMLNRNIARAHLQAAVDSAQDSVRTIDRVRRRGEAPRNMTGAACSHCSFAALCRAQMLGGPEGEYAVGDFGLEHRPAPATV
jgi:hypothetical protein